jgi:hypothetical protein
MRSRTRSGQSFAKYVQSAFTDSGRITLFKPGKRWRALNQSGVSFDAERKEIMSTLITWNPFGELDELQNRLGGLFFNGFPNRMGFPNPMGNGDALKLADGSPLVDITQDDQEYLFKADLPEMKRWSEIDAEILSFLARSGSTSISISECVSNVEIFESKAHYRRVGFSLLHHLASRRHPSGGIDKRRCSRISWLCLSQFFC